LRETLLASVETERSWSEVCKFARTVQVDFCSVATEVLATETLMCFCVWSTGLSPESSSSNFSLSEWMQVFDGDGLRILIVALRHYLLVAEEDLSP